MKKKKKNYIYVKVCKLCHYKFICTNLKNGLSCGKLDCSWIPKNKWYKMVHFHAHIASTKSAFGMPGHGSPPKYLLDKGMEHVLLPIQAYKSHYKGIFKSV